jgi:riboflavin kinase / FMN adenylyltransferase
VKIIRTFADLKTYQYDSVLTIGVFDGLHKGHQQIIKKIVRQAKNTFCKSVLVCFEPYPYEYLSPDNEITRINTFANKVIILKKYNLDYLLVLKFNHYLANLSAGEFVDTILIRSLRTKFLYVGDDFCFGKKRLGNFGFLKQQASKYGFDVEKTPTILYNGKRISSTRVKKELKEANFKDVKNLLGRNYSICGKVCYGKKLGTKIGFPTANINIGQKQPLNGVFVVKVCIKKNKIYNGVANVGSRPTVDGTKRFLEVHVFNFNKNIYKKRIEVYFLKKLRDEIKFDDVAKLKKQIKMDIMKAYEFLS